MTALVLSKSQYHAIDHCHCVMRDKKQICLANAFHYIAGSCSVNHVSWRALHVAQEYNWDQCWSWHLSEYLMWCQNINMNWMCSVVAMTLAVVAMSTSSSAQAACHRISNGGFLRESLRIDAYNSPCLIHDDLIIGARAALTVDPGVTLQFSPGVMLAVNGTLIARVSLSSQPTFLTVDNRSAVWCFVRIKINLVLCLFTW